MGMFSYSDRTQLTTHFNIREFRCNCGHVHNILINEAFVNKLEKLFSKLNAKYALISSGHRCATYDKSSKIGGSGQGAHVSGLAADICYFSDTNVAIPADVVCCVAQDLGFSGIANISDKMMYVHLDEKPRTKPYRGDERLGFNSVTTDFYKYFNMSAERVAEYTGDVVAAPPAPMPTPAPQPEVAVQEFDYQYDEQIAELQKILNKKGAKLHVDGKAGPDTLATCKKYTIRKGDKGPLTQWVQERLNCIGHACGEPDGIAGKQTMKGIASFQKANKLGTGYLGGNDWYFLIK